MRKFAPTLIFLLLFVWLMNPRQIHAQSLTNLGEKVLSSTAKAPGDKSDYYYFGVETQQHLTNFSEPEVTANVSGSDYNPATAPGGTEPFKTGAVFHNSEEASTKLFSFTLTNEAEPNFNVYFLVNNVTNPDFDTTSITIESYVNNELSATQTQTVTPGEGINTYVGFSVQKATKGMEFRVYTNGGVAGDHQAVGGVTFLAVR